jgi:sec-independent protein translocase protein TatA
MIGTWEVILIVFAIVLLFGSKKIPELMRGLGSGVREFKKGMREGNEPEKIDKRPDNNKEKE